ncbi:MAG: PAS domain-containing protein [Planctomycetes bacterium]|nr:PAS domain-containing protein [Planctomycetota bacterium]
MSPKPLRVLVIEDNPADTRMLLEGLAQHESGLFEQIHAGRLSEGLEALSRGGIDVVLLDLSLPDSEGLDTLLRARAQALTVPIVVLTGTTDEPMALQAVQDGAQDYLVKGSLPGNLLARTLLYAIERNRTQMEKAALHRTIERGKQEWETTVDALAESVALLDAEQRVVRCNQAAADLFGLSWEEILGRHFTDLFFRGQAMPENDLFCRLLRSGNRESEEVYLPDRKQWVEVSVHPLREASGQLSGAVAVVGDITDRKRVERERSVVQILQKTIGRAKKEWETTADALEECVALVDAGQRVVRCNRAMSQFLQLPWEEILGRPFRSLLFAEDAPAGRDPFLAMVETRRKQAQEVYLSARGRWILLSVSPILDPTGQLITGGVETLVDVTDRRQAEQETESLQKSIQRAKSEWEATIDALAESVALVDLEEKIVRCNRAAAEFLGLPWEEILHRSFPDLLLAGHVLLEKDPFAEMMRSRKRESTEFYHPDRKRWIQLGVSPLFDPAGQLIGAVETVADITRRKEAEETLLKANQELQNLDRMKSEFVSTVSHELRTPLTSMSNALSNIRAGVVGKVNPQLKEYIDLLQTDCVRLCGLVENLLDMSRLESGRMMLYASAIDVQAIAEETLKAFEAPAEKKGLSLRAEIPDSLTPPYADKAKISQVLTNLVGNALKFTPPGGRITIQAEESSPEGVTLRVSDTGIGIAPEFHEKIFEKFFQVRRPDHPHQPGTGLGLAICKEILSLHGAKIGIESQPGRGCTFSFTLPKALPDTILRADFTMAIERARAESSVFTILRVHLAGAGPWLLLQRQEQGNSLLQEITQAVKASFRRGQDIVVLQGDASVTFILWGIVKSLGPEVEKRARESLQPLAGLRRLHAENSLSVRSVSYPEDGSTPDELLNRLEETPGAVTHV